MRRRSARAVGRLLPLASLLLAPLLLAGGASDVPEFTVPETVVSPTRGEMPPAELARLAARPAAGNTDPESSRAAPRRVAAELAEPLAAAAAAAGWNYGGNHDRLAEAYAAAVAPALAAAANLDVEDLEAALLEPVDRGSQSGLLSRALRAAHQGVVVRQHGEQQEAARHDNWLRSGLTRDEAQRMLTAAAAGARATLIDRVPGDGLPDARVFASSPALSPAGAYAMNLMLLNDIVGAQSALGGEHYRGTRTYHSIEMTRALFDELMARGGAGAAFARFLLAVDVAVPLPVGVDERGHLSALGRVAVYMYDNNVTSALELIRALMQLEERSCNLQPDEYEQELQQILRRHGGWAGAHCDQSSARDKLLVRAPPAGRGGGAPGGADGRRPRGGPRRCTSEICWAS